MYELGVYCVNWRVGRESCSGVMSYYLCGRGERQCCGWKGEFNCQMTPAVVVSPQSPQSPLSCRGLLLAVRGTIDNPNL